MIMLEVRYRFSNFIARFRKPKPLTLDDMFCRLFMRENRLARLKAMQSGSNHAYAADVLNQLIAKDTELVEKAQAEIGMRVQFLRNWQKQRDDEMQKDLQNR